MAKWKTFIDKRKTAIETNATIQIEREMFLFYLNSKFYKLMRFDRNEKTILIEQEASSFTYLSEHLRILRVVWLRVVNMFGEVFYKRRKWRTHHIRARAKPATEVICVSKFQIPTAFASRQIKNLYHLTPYRIRSVIVKSGGEFAGRGVFQCVVINLL